MKPLKFCCTGDGKPVHPPSKVLCKECLAALSARFDKIAAEWPKAKEATDESR